MPSRQSVLAIASLALAALASLVPANAVFRGASVHARQPAPAEPPAKSLSPAEAAVKLDALILQASSHPPVAAAVSDELFLRRAALDVTGKLPSLNHITRFAVDPSPDKRAQAVEQLLASPDFGGNWGRYWRDVVMYRRTEDRALIGSRSLESFLTEQLNQNVGWGQIAVQLLTGAGDVSEEGRTGLILAQQAQAEEVAAEVSRIFLGIQIQCAQCHDHPTDRWKREQFHQLAAFFPRMSLRPVMEDGRPRSFEVVSVDRALFRQRPGGQRRGSLEHYMTDLNDPSAKGKLITPTFFATGQSLTMGQRDLERRETLAQWITTFDVEKNPWFATAFVNRTWAELVGRGFYEPIDDLGPDRQADAPEAVAFLAAEFAASGHDVKWLFRTILSTDAYQRGAAVDSVSSATENPDPSDAPFAARKPQRLRSDQLYDALTTALGLNDLTAFRFGGRFQRPGQTAGPMGRIASPRGLFANTFGFDPSDPRDEVAGSIPPALFMMNSPLLNTAIDGRSPRTELGRLLNSTTDDRQAVSELYLRCLGRTASDSEIAVCLKHISQSPGRSEAYEDLLWSLLNTTEFLHRR